ncbi:mercuric transporter MerT family protein [uncultured Maricaulis sp.]|uniref:mercuric transporter MerT family protein n=1 Tax=uncultured Maricaulis sp. TaxID=174710 RepID=UPI0030DCB17C|tara:strand:- start:314814 stop:315200 length:387 start_codon:yes stop_codon:yes gene_type:complete
MAEIDQDTLTKPGDRQSGRLLATGGILGAVLASSCCILPLILVLTGVSGAWIGSLTALEPYKPYFILVTLAMIGVGFWHVYFKPQPACEPGSACARPESRLVTKTALWAGLAIVLLAATIDLWAPLFY